MGDAPGTLRFADGVLYVWRGDAWIRLLTDDAGGGGLAMSATSTPAPPVSDGVGPLTGLGVGAGARLEAYRYARGWMLDVWAQVTVGAGGVTGPLTLTVPAAAASPSPHIGVARGVNTTSLLNPGQRALGIVEVSGTVLRVVAPGGSSAWGPLVPFVWGAGDVVDLAVRYPLAAPLT